MKKNIILIIKLILVTAIILFVIFLIHISNKQKNTTNDFTGKSEENITEEVEKEQRLFEKFPDYLDEYMSKVFRGKI